MINRKLTEGTNNEGSWVLTPTTRPSSIDDQSLIQKKNQPAVSLVLGQAQPSPSQTNKVFGQLGGKLKHSASARSVFALGSSSMHVQSSSMSPMAGAGLQAGQPALRNYKLRRQDEGLDGLPESFSFDGRGIEDAEQCFSCHKTLARKFGGIMKKGRHHCRKCGRTVCDRCRQNKRRLAKGEKKEEQVCDQCDFEIGNYQMFHLIERMTGMQTQMHAQV